MNVGLVLSGGGIKGVAHIGVIKALEENGIYPTVISGSSAGAVVGAFYASGFTIDEMLTFFKTTPLLNINRYSFSKPGFMDTDKFYKDFKKYFPEDNFNTLQKKLFVTAVDLLSGNKTVFEHGELIRAFLASAAYPGIFSPVSLNNSLYADGGILDNFPVTPLLPLCDKIIGVNVSPFEKINAKKLKNTLDVLDRAFKINIAHEYMPKFSHCDLLIRPHKLNEFGLFSKNHIDDIFNIGYEEAKKMIKENKASIKLKVKK